MLCRSFFSLFNKRVCFSSWNFLEDPSQNFNGTYCPLFSDSFVSFEEKTNRVFCLKSIKLCQLLQLLAGFDGIFRIYSPKLGRYSFDY